MDEFIKLFPDVQDVFADATERAVQRPVNSKKLLYPKNSTIFSKYLFQTKLVTL
jgi:hypothetical protein